MIFENSLSKGIFEQNMSNSPKWSLTDNSRSWQAAILKSLIGVDAKGGIVFVSQLYTGSISDKEIVIRSGFLEILKNKVAVGEILADDAVMADKGFDIGDKLKKLTCISTFPHFLQTKVHSVRVM